MLGVEQRTEMVKEGGKNNQM